MKSSKREAPKISLAVILIAAVVILEAMILGVNYYFYQQEKSQEIAGVIGATQVEAAKNPVPRSAAAVSNPPLLTNFGEIIGLPLGYILESYAIEKTLSVACRTDNSCVTPAKYLVQSRCPFTTKCVNSSCTVVCPQRKDITWSEAEKIIQDSSNDILFQPGQL